jgi:hypothetical protein
VWFKASPGKKFARPHLNQWLDMIWWLLEEVQIGELWYMQLKHNERPHLKIASAKRAVEKLKQESTCLTSADPEFNFQY